MRSTHSFTVMALSLAMLSSARAAEEYRPHAGMLLFPDVSAELIVFVHANDLWTVPRSGGTATPLASPPGREMFPRFSPDGQSIAFMGNYDGGRDLYTVPVAGGVPTRLTYHPAAETLCDWTATHGILFHTNAFTVHQEQLMTVPPEGGAAKPLPVKYGSNGAIGPDGVWLAFTPLSRDFRTWKRYRGGMASDIWLFNLENYASRKAIDWEGTDTYPMWHGDTLYYLSDAGPNHRLNIWEYHPDSGERKQITHFAEYDCKFPAVGPGADGEGEIVFQNGAELYLLNLSTQKARAVEVAIPGARPKLRNQNVDASENIMDSAISPTGKRAALEARGDIWTLPAKEGSVRNLTRTSGAAERDPAWSPDGRWIAYFSDATGEYELYTIQSDGGEEAKQLTSGGGAFRYEIVWAPDSKKLAYHDKTGSLFLFDVETRKSTLIDKTPYPIGMYTFDVSWSRDSAWMAYAKQDKKMNGVIHLYNVEGGESRAVTSGAFNDTRPVFDRKGDFLYFVGNRHFESPIYDDYGWGLGKPFAYTGTEAVLAVPLRADVEHPYRFESDEEPISEESNGENNGDGDESGKEGEKDSDSGDSAKKEEEEKPVEIGLDGFEARAFILPVKPGNFRTLAVNGKNQLIYVREAPPQSGLDSKIQLFDPSDDKKEEKTVLEGPNGFRISADGKTLLVQQGNRFAMIDAEPDQKMDETLDTSNMLKSVNPREEWKQILADAWRIQRDFFYDPNMHGNDWEAIREQYEAMLADCASREDVSFVIGEMISEINVGHAYYFGGDHEEQPSVNVGMLGVDFEARDGAYRIKTVYRGAPWDADARNPLDRIPRDQADEGDYALAVNGVPLDAELDPYAAFIGMANETVTLTVNDSPEWNGDERHVPVKLLGNERELRFRHWIEEKRAYTARKSGGKVGYIYVTNTSRNGQNDLFRQFYGQRDKEALIIDERWNGGGQAPSRFIELLNRPISNYWALRDGESIPWPEPSHQGPKCMLINGRAGSGGDMFPALFRHAGLGKLVGTRTWGGLVGMSGNPRLIDGGYTAVPTFAYYETDGTWGIEGHGVDPDIEVEADPSVMANGGDPQLDAAIELMLREIKSHPYNPPPRPEYPDRSGMGIREEDK